MTKRGPFRYFKTSPWGICLAVMLYGQFALFLGNMEDFLYKRGTDIRHETIRFWWNRFGQKFAAENSQLPFQRRERAMLRFRRMRCVQKFAAVHSSVHNHFDQERHLYSRDNYMLNRAAALAEWRAVLRGANQFTDS